MVLESAVPSVNINWESWYFALKISLIIIVSLMPLVAIGIISMFRVRGIIIQKRIGKSLRGKKVWGKYTKARAGEVKGIKLFGRLKTKQRIPSHMVATGRKDFAVWLENQAGALQAFKIIVDPETTTRVIKNAIKKATIKGDGISKRKLVDLLVKYFCPSLQISDLDWAFWKAQQDKETDLAYSKSKWQNIMLIGGLVIIVIIFALGMIFIKNACK